MHTPSGGYVPPGTPGFTRAMLEAEIRAAASVQTQPVRAAPQGTVAVTMSRSTGVLGFCCWFATATPTQCLKRAEELCRANGGHDPHFVAWDVDKYIAVVFSPTRYWVGKGKQAEAALRAAHAKFPKRHGQPCYEILLDPYGLPPKEGKNRELVHRAGAGTVRVKGWEIRTPNARSRLAAAVRVRSTHRAPENPSKQ